MAINQKNNINLMFICINTLFQTACCLLPGIISTKGLDWKAHSLFLLIIYMLLSNFSILLLKSGYRDGLSISIQFYGVKLALSLLLICSFALNTKWQFGVILACFEIFQFLIFSSKYHYPDTLLFTFTTAFFSGLVFNLLIVMLDEQRFNLKLALPFLMSVAIMLLNTLISQKIYSYLNRQRLFGFISLLTIIAAGLLLWYYYKQKFITDWVFYLMMVGLLFDFISVNLNRNYRKKEMLSNVISLILIIFFFNNFK